MDPGVLIRPGPRGDVTLNLERTRVAGPDALSLGKHTITAVFEYSGGGIGKPADITLLVDGQRVADGRIERTVPIRMSLDETMDIGEDAGTLVNEDYHVPFRFTGEIESVTVELR